MENVKVIWFDLWRTLVRSHCAEPVYKLQQILGHGLTLPEGGQEIDDFEPSDDFLKHCLTTDIRDTRQFMENAAAAFSGSVDDSGVDAFTKVIAAESKCVSQYWDVRMTLEALRSAGYRIGLISNLWPFPVQHIFEEDHGLGEYFPRELRVYSFESGHRKPDPEIFLDALDRVGLAPEECLMVGDNLKADCIGSRMVGMNAALIDRDLDHKPEDLPMGIVHLADLTKLMPLLAT